MLPCWGIAQATMAFPQQNSLEKRSSYISKTEECLVQDFVWVEKLRNFLSYVIKLSNFNLLFETVKK